MSVSLTASIKQTLTVLETLDATLNPGAAAANRVIRHDQFNVDANLTTAGTPAALEVITWSQTLTAGTASIDLTALVGTNSRAISGVGKKVRALLVQNPSTQYAVAIAADTSTPYWGTSQPFDAMIPPGASIMAYNPDDGTSAASWVDISSSAKTILLNGTGTTAVKCQLILG